MNKCPKEYLEEIIAEAQKMVSVLDAGKPDYLHPIMPRVEATLQKIKELTEAAEHECTEIKAR